MPEMWKSGKYGMNVQEKQKFWIMCGEHNLMCWGDEAVFRME
jgi:hypothetical protein